MNGSMFVALAILGVVTSGICRAAAPAAEAATPTTDGAVHDVIVVF